jgi:hypothetical protein
MLFIVHWQIKPEHRDAVMQRLKEIGNCSPEGVRVVGSWHSVTQDEGWAVAEASDPVMLGKWQLGWTDLNVNHVTPVVDDADMMKIVGSHKPACCST